MPKPQLQRSVRISAALILSSLIAPVILRAEALEVYQDEYVISRPAMSELNTLSQASNLSTVAVHDGHLLVKFDGGSPNGLASFEEREIVPYSELDNRCAEIEASLPGVLCSPNYIERLNLTPNDTLFATYQWALNNNTAGEIDIDGPQAWDITTGSQSVYVAVIDSGVDLTHPDLTPNLWTNPGEVANNGADDDGDGYIDDVRGFNTITNSGDVADDHGHGTNIHGIIGARGNNQIGVAGTAFNVTLIPVKAFNSQGSADTISSVAAIDYVVNLKTRKNLNIVAINYSAGGSGASSVALAAITRARDAGILFVAASGNNSKNNDVEAYFPANYDLANIIAVGAVERNGSVSSYSNYGATMVDLFAPGSSIASTGRGNVYQNLGGGTSYSTAFVTGATALIKSAFPTNSYDAIKYRIMSSAVHTNQTPGKALSGVLSLRGMLGNIQIPNPPPPTPTPTPTPPVNPTPTPTANPTPGGGGDDGGIEPGKRAYSVDILKLGKPKKSAGKKKKSSKVSFRVVPIEGPAPRSNGDIQFNMEVGGYSCPILSGAEAVFDRAVILTVKLGKVQVKKLKANFSLKRPEDTLPASNVVATRVKGKTASADKPPVKKIFSAEAFCAKTKLKSIETPL